MDWVPILDQYLMREMVPVLVLAVAVCSSLGMSLGALAGLLQEVAVSGLRLRVPGAAAVLQLPSFAAVSMPTARLSASLFGLGRLQSDMESVALFAAGVPLADVADSIVHMLGGGGSETSLPRLPGPLW